MKPPNWPRTQPGIPQEIYENVPKRPMTLSADERSLIEARHWDNFGYCNWCVQLNQPGDWPCDTEKMRAALVAAEARAKALAEALEAIGSSGRSEDGVCCGCGRVGNMLHRERCPFRRAYEVWSAYREAGG